MKKVIRELKKFMAAMLLVGILQLSACSFKLEALYHGETPVGINDQKATQLAQKK